MPTPIARLRYGTILRGPWPAVGLAGMLLVAGGCGQRKPEVELQTPLGSIRMELYPERAPFTVANFLRYVDEGRYANAAFYRVRREEAALMRSPTGVVQGGLWYSDPDSSTLLPPIPLESTRLTGLRHTEGIVSMARFAEGAGARAEFFIVLGRQPHLDHQDSVGRVRPGYAAFGKVVEGMEVVRAIQRLPVLGERLQKPVPFRAVRVR